MKSFNEMLSEALNTTFEIIDSDENCTTLGHLKNFDEVSPKITEHDVKNYIGTIGYEYSGRQVWYEMFELEDFDKKEFGQHGVFAFSSKKMHHFPRVLGQIRNGKIYFINNEKYEDGDGIVFDGRGVKIKFLRIKHDKYKKGKLKPLL